MSLRWLHLSDVHEAARDGVNRVRMYDQILAEVERREGADVVFLTGDVAFAGEESEYRSLEKSFIEPLKNIVGPDCPLFVVPGNHDLDRRRAVPPRSWINLEQQRSLFQAVDAEGSLKRSDVLMPRFKAYADFDARVSAWPKRWLESDAGAAVWTGDINGHRIGVVGLNTAWLCQDDEDWGRISPGRYMAERALEAASAASPHLLFALGHHPLGAFAVEHQPEQDGGRIRERLERHKAVYLHGHLHRTGSDQTGAGPMTALTIQAPSAFQAHDNDRWRNGVVWGEADFDTRKLILTPLRWNENFLEYKFDTDAFPESDRVPNREAYQVDMPGTANPAPDPTEAPVYEAPPGWEVMDRDAIAGVRNRPPSQNEMIAYFDGLLPTWRLALANGVEARGISKDILARFRLHHEGAPKPLGLILLGAGGEGKSSVMLQVAAALIEGDQHWSCLRRQSATAPVPVDTFSRLPQIAGHAWIVMIDDGEVAAPEVLAAIRKASPRTDIHLLLTARTADWAMTGVTAGDWAKVVNYRPMTLSGLTEEDALRIVRGWSSWGERAMGKLVGQGDIGAARELVRHARALATRKEQGELLGALLITRLGEDMREHVRTLIGGLSQDHVLNGFSLVDAYAVIATMHAENRLFLSLQVMAQLFQTSLGELDRDVIKPLQAEAMTDPGRGALLTRHRLIAETACEVLREDGYDIDRWYAALARAASILALRREHVPSIASWRFDLARHFVKKGEHCWPLARQIALAVYDADTGNIPSLTAYSSILRDTNRPDAAYAVLETRADELYRERSFLKEWSTVAGVRGDPGLSAWLCACSMADGPSLDETRVSLALDGLAISFHSMHAGTTAAVYARGEAACGQLGLMISPQRRHRFQVHADNGTQNGVAAMDIVQAISAIAMAATRAALEVKPENNPVYFERLIGDPDGYGYQQSLALIRALLGKGGKH